MKGDDWKPDLPIAMKSAYREHLGKEPDFTNYAKVLEKPTFVDTLDYLFYAGDSLQVVDVLPLPHRDEVVGPLPNDDEPSDHLLLAATFSFQR